MLKDEDEIKAMLRWLKDENAPEPESMPSRGVIWDRDQAIEILEWALNH